MESKLDFARLRLYGRATELKLLGAAYTQSIDSGKVVWVKGYPGTGKSTLVEDAFRQKETLCRGKFEQSDSVVPYSAFVHFLSDLCCLLASRPQSTDAVEIRADDAAVLEIVVPEITGVVKVASAREKEIAPPVMNEYQLEIFKRALRSFIKAACDKLEFPLIMVLDDLQWADLDSLDILQDLLTSSDISGLLFVGLYRDNEISEQDALSRCIKAIANCKKSEIGDHVLELQILNLDVEAINQLVADCLRIGRDSVRPLSDLIHKKTGGNCFFTLQMLRCIHEKKLLYFSTKTYQWSWSIDKIREEISVSDNVGELLCKRIGALSGVTLRILKLSACLGTTVDIGLVESLVPLLDSTGDQSICSIYDAIDLAAEANLIEVTADRTRFNFSHDLIRSSVYELLSGKKVRQSLHLRIGRLLRDRTFQGETNDVSLIRQVSNHVKLTVKQLNLGAELIDDEEERTALANLNLAVAKEVMKAGAFRFAATFLEMGLGLLGSSRWDDRYYYLTLHLSNALSSVLFSNGNMSESIALVSEIREKAKCLEDRIEAQFIHIQILSCTNRLGECLDVGLRALKDLGHSNIPRKPSSFHVISAILGVKRRIRGVSDDDILSMNVLSDTNMLHAMRHMGDLTIVAYFAGVVNLIPILQCRMMRILLKDGISEVAARALAQYGFLLTTFGYLDMAYRFATLALRLMERFGEDPRALYWCHLVLHLKKPIHESVNPLIRAYDLAFSRGDMQFAGQACVASCSIRSAAGLSVQNLFDDSIALCRQMEQYNQRDSLILLQVGTRAQSELLNQSNKRRIEWFGEHITDDDSFEQYLQNSTNSETPLFFFWMYTMEVRFILGDMKSALFFAKKCWRSNALRGALPLAAGYYFFSALTALHFWTKSRKLRYLLIGRKFYRNLLFSRHGNPNTGSVVALLDAEFLVMSEKTSSPETIRSAFEKSIIPATRFGFICVAAMANERVGRFFYDRRICTGQSSI